MIKWEKFGRDALRWRKKLDVSIRDAAKLCRVTHATLSRAERGMVISADNFLKIVSYALDKDPRSYL